MPISAFFGELSSLGWPIQLVLQATNLRGCQTDLSGLEYSSHIMSSICTICSLENNSLVAQTWPKRQSSDRVATELNWFFFKTFYWSTVNSVSVISLKTLQTMSRKTLWKSFWSQVMSGWSQTAETLTIITNGRSFELPTTCLIIKHHHAVHDHHIPSYWGLSSWNS